MVGVVNEARVGGAVQYKTSAMDDLYTADYERRSMHKTG